MKKIEIKIILREKEGFYDSKVTYLNDEEVELKFGSVDTIGSQNYGKNSNVPLRYVYDFQTDLKKLGFVEVGLSDGDFGRKTKKALINFQRISATGQRQDKSGNIINVKPIFNGKPTGKVDKKTKLEIKEWLISGYIRFP